MMHKAHAVECAHRGDHKLKDVSVGGEAASKKCICFCLDVGWVAASTAAGIISGAGIGSGCVNRACKHPSEPPTEAGSLA